ncbi:MAG TPA: ATP-binding cassette domain-containing protein [Vicinamibacterales bacterium]|nr:ATP-binding cassette domain-containing protein [Vicinamibacterales bacterium]
MSAVMLSVRALAAHYGRRLVFEDVSFDVGTGQCLGVVGANGAGKTTLLRTLVGCITPLRGEVRINGLLPRDALARTGVAYFAGEATLPGFVRAAAWGSLGNGDAVTDDRRRLRALSRGTRQLLGLRTVLGRQPLGLVILDEPWDGLDPDAAKWLSATLESKRDRGAGVVLASHRLHDLAGLCDLYLLLFRHRSVLVKAHELAPAGSLTPEVLADVFDRLRAGSQSRQPSQPVGVAM